MVIQPLERAHKPSVSEFHSAFAGCSKPVILTGVTNDWPARQLWTVDYFKEMFGDVEADLRGSDDESEVFFNRHPDVKMRLAEYFDLIRSPAPSERPPYLGNIPFHDPRARKLLAPLESHFEFPKYFPDQNGSDFRLWIGAAGQKSTIHNDDYHGFNAQILGRKTFLLFSPEQYPALYTQMLTEHCWISPVDALNPDYERYPRFKEARALQGTLEEGDMLYLPPFWWHQVWAETVCLNLNMWVYRAVQKHLFWEQS
jgi:peptidyl-lysine (3S)-dioxygenase / protease